MNVTTGISKRQQKILTALINKGQIQLRDLADFLGMSSNQVRVQVRKLEKIGHVTIKAKKYYKAPLEICINTAFSSTVNAEVAKVMPNFDKWLSSGRWV